MLCADLLAPEGYGEIIGGSQREDDPDVLLKSITDSGLDPERYGWYFRPQEVYGSVPHSGFGLGIERTLAWICGAQALCARRYPSPGCSTGRIPEGGACGSPLKRDAPRLTAGLGSSPKGLTIKKKNVSGKRDSNRDFNLLKGLLYH